MSHTCHAYNCNEHVPPKLLMCYRHWKIVPLALRRAVWDTYRPGQERDKCPSAEYLAAAQAAIAAVSVAEMHAKQ